MHTPTQCYALPCSTVPHTHIPFHLSIRRVYTNAGSDDHVLPLHRWLNIFCRLFTTRGRDSSVGIATRYGLDGPAIESRWRARFSAPVQTGPGAHPASYTMGTGSFPTLKRPGRGVDHPPLSSAEVKERVELYLYSPPGPSWPVLGWTLIFNFTFFTTLSYLKTTHCRWWDDRWTINYRRVPSITVPKCHDVRWIFNDGHWLDYTVSPSVSLISILTYAPCFSTHLMRHIIWEGRFILPIRTS